jgi:hypothetical protein
MKSLKTMRKILYFFMFAALLSMISCVKPGERTRMVDKKLPIEELVDSFMMQHPNYLNNEVTMEEGDKEFQKIIIDTTTNYLEGIPMELVAINKNGKAYMAQFQSWIKPNGFEYQAPIYKVNFDILTAIPDSLISTLKEKDYYILEGAVIERMANMRVLETLLGKSSMGTTPIFGIRKNDTWDDKYDVNMGLIYFHMTSIEPYTEREKIEEKY